MNEENRNIIQKLKEVNAEGLLKEVQVTLTLSSKMTKKNLKRKKKRKMKKFHF